MCTFIFYVHFHLSQNTICQWQNSRVLLLKLLLPVICLIGFSFARTNKRSVTKTLNWHIDFFPPRQLNHSYWIFRILTVANSSYEWNFLLLKAYFIIQLSVRIINKILYHRSKKLKKKYNQARFFYLIFIMSETHRK